MGAVVEQARKLVENGYREVVLTGVDATSYGADLPGNPTLGLLAKTLLKQVPEILRFASLRSTASRRTAISSTSSPTSRVSCRICICRCSMATT